jgi:energy-coupling factor transport system substrate-specific component
MTDTTKTLTTRTLSGALYALATILGILAFLYPFWLPTLARSNNFGQAHTGDAPLLMTLLVGLCFAVLLLEVQGQGMGAKMLALLGILVAMNSVLRFAEVAIPGPGGFSPIFLLVVLAGYVYGTRFGFLLGALTILVSGLITGGVGPWMPYQMFVAGWTGMAAPLCRPLVRLFHGDGAWTEVIVLAVYGAVWGLIYGMVMNIWFWPFIDASSAGDTWAPGMTIAETVRSYLVFYAVTSLLWDMMRAAGNFVLILAFGEPVLRVLRRFHDRFTYTYTPAATGAVTDVDGIVSPVKAATSAVIG